MLKNKVNWYIMYKNLEGMPMNMNIKDIHKSAKEASRNHMGNYKIVVKSNLKIEINNKREEYVRLKVDLDKMIDDSRFGSIMNTVAIILSIIAITASMGSQPSDTKLSASDLYLMIFLTLYSVLICIYAVPYLINRDKYRYLKELLEDMGDNWEYYFGDK